MKKIVILFFILVSNVFSYMIYEDKTNNITFEEIINYKDKFYYSDKSSFGVSSSSLWLKVKLVNNTSKTKKKFLMFTHPALEQIDLFCCIGDDIIKKSSGLQIPLTQREIKFSDSIFDIDLPPNTQKEVFIKVKTSTLFDFDHIVFNNYEELLEYLLLKKSFTFFVFGLTCIVFVLMVLISIFNDESLYKVYMLFLFLTFLLQLFLGGYIQYLFSFDPYSYNIYFLMIVDLLAVVMFVFLMLILDIKKNMPRISYVVYGFIVLHVFFFISEPLAIFEIRDIKLNFFTPLTVVFYLVIIILAIKKNVPLSRFVFLGWMAYLVTGSIVILHFMDILQNSYAFIYFQFGIAIEVVVFTILLLYKFKLTYDEKKEKDLKIREKDLEIREKDIIIYRQSKFVTIGETLSNLEHQWRSPLSKISSNILNLQSYLEFKGMPTKEHLNSSLENITNTLQYMTHLVDNFKSFYKAEKDKRNFFLANAIKSALSLFEYDAKKLNIQIDLEIKGDYVVYGYSSELTQVVLNFLSNSKDIFIERNTKEPKISIQVSQEKQKLYIVILDNGGGVNKQNIGNIFQQFYSSKKRESTGIGLYMSKLIIENRMNGILEAKNTDRGLKLIITLNAE